MNHEEAIAFSREGVRRAERHLELDPNHIRALTLGAGALVALGEPERAREWCGRAIATAADSADPSLTYNTACVYARLGENEAALDALEIGVARGLGKRDWMLHDPDLDGLRNEPRFAEMLAKLS